MSQSGGFRIISGAAAQVARNVSCLFISEAVVLSCSSRRTVVGWEVFIDAPRTPLTFASP
jgi:hypothetical protein